MNDRAWFKDIDVEDVDVAARRISTGSTSTPRDWPTQAIEAGVVSSASDYHGRLREGALIAFEQELEALSGLADRELIQLVRTYDAAVQTVNELRQRISEAITETSTEEFSDTDIDALSEALAADGAPMADALSGLLETLESMQDELDRLEGTVTRQARAVAPNLSQLAGPLLAARLIAVAGSLEEIARMPSSTLQLLGAEGALFAHLRGEATSPKHGLIFMHPAVRSAPPSERGAIARTLAGKLSIAARIDHYRGELEPSLEADLATRLATIREGEE